MNIIQWLNSLLFPKSAQTLYNLGLSSYNPSQNGDTIWQGFSDKYGGTNFLSQQAATTQFERQKELQDRDFAFQQQMWQQTNEFNSPENQMNRLRQAGLNPSLAYGQPISEATPMSGSSVSAGMASGANGVGSIFDIISIPKRLELLDAEIDKTHAAARKDNTESDDIEGTREARIKQIWSNIERNSGEVKDILSKIQQRVHQNALTDAQRYNISFEQMLKRGQLSIDLSRLLNETNLTNKQIEQLDADIKKKLADAKVTYRQYQEMVWTFAIRKAGLEKQDMLTDAKIAEAYATAYNLFCQGEKTEVEKKRVEQLLEMDAPTVERARSLLDAVNSDDIGLFLLGQTFLGIDYVLDKVGFNLGVLAK